MGLIAEGAADDAMAFRWMRASARLLTDMMERVKRPSCIGMGARRAEVRAEAGRRAPMTTAPAAKTRRARASCCSASAAGPGSAPRDLAAGRPLRHHRECLSSKADIVQVAPEVAGAFSRSRCATTHRSPPATCCCGWTRSPSGLAVDKAEAELDAARTLVETARATYGNPERTWRAETARDYLQRQARRQQDLAARRGSATKLEETQNDAEVARDRMNVVRSRWPGCWRR